MDLTFDTLYEQSSKVLSGHSIQLRSASWFDPWTIGITCLKAIEFKDQPDKLLTLPEKKETLTYLKRMHFDVLLNEFAFRSFVQPLMDMTINENETDNVCEILHCEFRDEFEARLGSKIRKMFRRFGLDDVNEARATALVGELGNNVFDHNDGSWPTSVRGAIILAQHNPTLRRIEVAVADPGIGFRGSLKLRDPSITSDVNAIKLGLSGVSGRVDEKRGNGLLMIQDWTVNKFRGIVRIHSGNGIVVIDEDGQHPREVFPITGTLASLALRYN